MSHEERKIIMNEALSKEKLEYFKKRLLSMKMDIQAQMEDKKDIGPNDSIHEIADYDNHPADMGTEQFKQERDAGFKMMRNDRLQEIEDALSRIESGTYGLSEKSGKPIPEERLEAVPTARNLVEEEVN